MRGKELFSGFAYMLLPNTTAQKGCSSKEGESEKSLLSSLGENAFNGLMNDAISTRANVCLMARELAWNVPHRNTEPLLSRSGRLSK
jgi:hypothetical protein